MLNEIGSNFWINPNEIIKNKELGSPKQFGCMGSDFVWMSTGRSAIKFVIKTIEERDSLILKRVLLPSFTCHTVIEPFIEAGYQIEYYEVDESIRFNIEDICKKVNETKSGIVLFHRYYGFNTMTGDVQFIDKMRKGGIIFIEDCTQCLYSSFRKLDVDYIVGSIRKWLGTPDGGFAVCREGQFSEKPSRYDVSLEKAKVLASTQKYNYLFKNIGSKDIFLQYYSYAEDVLNKQNDFFTIGKISAQIQSTLDIENLIDSRRDNYKTLLKNVIYNEEVKPLFTELSNIIVPLYFPIIVKERQQLQAKLAQNSIYAPIVWPRPECLKKVNYSAEYLYNHLLCIPIDQRYGEEEMMRIADLLNIFIKNN